MYDVEIHPNDKAGRQLLHSTRVSVGRARTARKPEG